MLTTETVRRFNTLRALIYVHSPQVAEQNGFIVILDENGAIADTVARPVNHYSYRAFAAIIRINPLDVELVSIDGTPVIRETISLCHLAIMLT